MNKIKIVLLLSIFFLSISGVACGETEYDVVVRNFLSFLGSGKGVASTEMIENNALDPTQPKVAVAYLAHLSGGGYILISVSHDLTPVKAYSLDRSYESLPKPYRDFLMLEAEYNVRALSFSRTAQSVTENQKRWEFLITFDEMRSPLAYAPDTYLLSTKWSQGYPYNKFLPQIDGHNTIAGCVNVAIAQLMKYYKSPAAGKGVHSYTWNGQELKTILFRNFNWENMPDVLDGSTPEYKVDEVALLMKDIGIVNNTLFGIDYSEASINVSGMMEYFGLSNTTKSMDNTSDVNLFFSTLKNEIDAMRPVLLNFPGHLTVADGYASDPSGRKIHVNMGWGGYANDYYYLDNKVKAGDIEFDPNLLIYYNIKPCGGGDCYTNLESIDTLSAGTINGRFDMEKDIDKYTVFLKGNTSISAGRGLYNIAFFVSIYDDATGSLVYKMDDNAKAGTSFSAGNLAAGRYTIRASLCNDKCTSSYGLDANNSYSVSFVTDPIGESEKAEIINNLDDGPVMGNTLKDRVLNTASSEPFKVLIDARDKNGDTVEISIINSNSNAALTSLTNNVLSITPVATATKTSSKITIKALANGKATEKSFVVMVLNEDVFFGKSFTVNGFFENQDDSNAHKVIFDGQCSIDGYNGYSTQAFYSSVRDLAGNIVVSPSNNSINYSFSKNLYLLGTSLRNGSSYYTYTTGHESYTFTVSCPEANDSTAVVAALLGIDLSGTLEKPETDLLLSTGWNFISLPIQPTNPSIQSVLKDISSNVKVVWGYDNQNKVWLSYKPSAMSYEPSANLLSAMDAGKGYWIYMDASGNMDMTNWTEPTATVTLYPGWNLIGYNGADGTINPPDGWIIIWGWENNTWKAKANPSLPYSTAQPLDSLSKGKAYWIKMSTGATWTQ